MINCDHSVFIELISYHYVGFFFWELDVEHISSASRILNYWNLNILQRPKEWSSVSIYKKKQLVKPTVRMMRNIKPNGNLRLVWIICLAYTRLFNSKYNCHSCWPDNQSIHSAMLVLCVKMKVFFVCFSF